MSRKKIHYSNWKAKKVIYLSFEWYSVGLCAGQNGIAPACTVGKVPAPGPPAPRQRVEKLIPKLWLIPAIGGRLSCIKLVGQIKTSCQAL